MKTFRNRPCVAKCGLLAAFVSAVTLVSSAATTPPSLSYLGANRPCDVLKNFGEGWLTNALDTVTSLNDGTTMYSMKNANFVQIDANAQFQTAMTGYESVWKTWASAPAILQQEGTNLATRVLATGSTLALSKSVLETLPVGRSGMTFLYADFSPITYNLAYNLDGGAWPKAFTAPQTATYDVAFTLENPSRTGYDFSGWDVNGVTHPSGSGTSMTFSNLTTVAGANVALTAQWKRKGCDLRLLFADGVSKISYRLQEEDGGWTDWQSVATASTVSVSFGLKWRAYCETGEHWQLTGSGSDEENYAEGTMGVDGAKFNPQPTRKSYALKLSSNPAAGGSARPTSGAYSYASESEVELEATPQTGYHFLKWSDGSGQNPHAITMLSETNVTAHFEKDVYTVTFAYRDETGVLRTEKQSVAYGESAREPGSAKRNGYTGYVFESWNDNTWGTITGNLNVNAEYAANTYTIRFLGNGATSGYEQVQTFRYDEEKNLEKNAYGRTGYAFSGWSTSPDGATAGSRRYSDQQLVRNIVTDSDGTARDTGAELVLYAQWTPITYTIHFEGNGAASGSMDDATVSYDTPFTLPACAFKNAQPFVNWLCSADGKTYADGETVVRLASESGRVTMTANWGKAATVTFDGNGGRGTMDAQTFTKDAEFSLQPNAFVKEGYAFAGWSVSGSAPAPGAVPAYEDQALVTTNTTFALSAIWTPNTYQVVFDANNGTTQNVTIVSNFIYDVDFTPTSQLGFSKPSGLDKFVGWGTNTTEVVYKPDDPKKNLSAINGDHIKLYAIWGLNDCGQYSRALGCENLKLDVVRLPQAWTVRSTCYTSLVFSAQSYSVLRDTRNVETGIYNLSYEWMPSNATSKLEIYWSSEKPIGGYSNVASCVWVKGNVRVYVTGEEKSKYLEIVPTNPCELRNVRWTRVPEATHAVKFGLGEGAQMLAEDRLCGGETNQTVEAGHVALEPTVRPPAGQLLKCWQVGDQEVPVGGVAWRDITRETTFAADYTNAEYKVVYVDARTADGWTNPNPPTVDRDDGEIALKPIQNAEGGAAPDFLGWSPAQIPAGTLSNFVVTAQWATEQTGTNTVWLVTVEDGVAVTNKIDVETGKNAILPTPPARAGHAFVGWEGSADAVTSDRTLTACYEKIAYPISYRNTRGLVNGNTTYAKLPLSYTVDEEVILDVLIPDADVTDVIFRGWSLDGGVTLTNGLAKGSTGEKIFTAVWTERAPAVVIGGVSRPVDYGTMLTETTPASVTNGTTNVVCVGWIGTGSVPASGTGNSVSFVVREASSLDWLYATNYWVSATATVDAGPSVDAGPCPRQNEGESSALGRGQGPASTCEGGTVALSDASGTLASTEGWFRSGTNLTATATPNEGWLFAGWQVDAGPSVDAGPCPRQNEGGSSTCSFTVASPVSLTAVFTQKVVRTTFDVDISVAEGCEKMGTVSGAKTKVKAGTKVTVKATAKSGYVFSGWYTVDASTCLSQSASYAFTMPSEDVALVAEFVAKGEDWATIAVGEIASESAPKVAIDPIAVTAEGGSLPTIKVTGLPSGLKFTAKPVTSKKTETVGGKLVTTLVTNAPANTIYGTPTRSGLYTAVATATTAGKATASTNLSFAVVDRAKGESIVSTSVCLLDADSVDAGVVPGKTTGQGVYAAGKKVTLRATANRGYVFSGWYAVDASTPVSRLASLALTVPDDDIAYAAAFVSTDDDAASISASVNGMALISPADADASSASALSLSVETNVSVGVYLEWPVAAEALSATTVAVSGLPAGLKFTAKPVTSRVASLDEAGKRVYATVTNVPAMTIYGTPTAASKVNSRTEEVTPSSVKVTVTTAGRNKAVGMILLTVDALPTALVGTYLGGSTNETVGSATVTLAKTGKISGKWISEGKTWTLAATGFDAVGTRAGARVYEATVTAKCGRETDTLALVFSQNDLGYGTVDAGPCPRQDPDADPALLFSATYVPWKTDAVLKARAVQLKGQTFSVSEEGATFTGKIGANGTVTVVGEFLVDAESPRVYKASVSSTLVPLNDELSRFELFLYYPYRKNQFDGYATTLVLAP